jgi:hypothetical protein
LLRKQQRIFKTDFYRERRGGGKKGKEGKEDKKQSFALFALFAFLLPLCIPSREAQLVNRK